MNSQRSPRDKCQMVADFFKDAWDTGLLDPPYVDWGESGKPDTPPDVDTVEGWITKATFPGMQLLTLDGWDYKARLWFYITTGEDKYLQ